MKEKKKGFTLIELLAVIVILAIIALIATPIVLNIINSAKKGAFARSAEGVVKSANLFYAQKLVDNPNAKDITFTCNNKECTTNDVLDTNGNPLKLDVDGKVGTGSVTIYEDGKVSLTLTDGTNVVTKEKDGKITVKKVITTPSGPTKIIKDLPLGVKAIFYLDPTNLSATCNEQNSTVGGNAKSGCMKWYAYKEDDASYTMILDHNTTASVEWNSAVEDLNKLSAWQTSPKLIDAKDVAEITGMAFTGNETGSLAFRGANTPSDYYWLYDYTYYCSSNGCKVSDDSVWGYWTSTLLTDSTFYAWGVWCTGMLTAGGTPDTRYGIRPVITINKADL